MRWLSVAAVLGAVIVLGHESVLRAIGSAMVQEDPAAAAPVAVVLLGTRQHNADRLLEAAHLFREGRVSRVVVNGNRKTDNWRRIEARGFSECGGWQETSLRVLELHGVPRNRVLAVSLEDAFDTVTEARTLAPALREAGIGEVVLVTSRFHTRRAGRIWRDVHGDALGIEVVGARDGAFDPRSWWRSRYQVRNVLSELGAWAFYLLGR